MFTVYCMRTVHSGVFGKHCLLPTRQNNFTFNKKKFIYILQAWEMGTQL